MIKIYGIKVSNIIKIIISNYTYIYIYIYIHTYTCTYTSGFNKFPDFFVQAFKIVIDS